MNYIKSLEKLNTLKNSQIIMYESGLNELVCYLSSSKFWEDTTVQVADVIHRIYEIKSQAARVEVES